MTKSPQCMGAVEWPHKVLPMYGCSRMDTTSAAEPDRREILAGAGRAGCRMDSLAGSDLRHFTAGARDAEGRMASFAELGVRAANRPFGWRLL